MWPSACTVLQMNERDKPIFEAGPNNDCLNCGGKWRPGLVLRTRGNMQWKILRIDFKPRPTVDRQNNTVNPGAEFEWCNGNQHNGIPGTPLLAKKCQHSAGCTFVHEKLEKMLWETPCAFEAADGHCLFEATHHAKNQCPMQHSPPEYKSKLCINYLGMGETQVKGYCKYGKKCLYLHQHDPDWKAKGYKTEPDSPHWPNPKETPKFRTKTCYNWKYGNCTYGPSCWFAHTDEPERMGAVGDYNLTNYRKDPCAWFSNRIWGCRNGNMCKWYHEGEHEPWTRENPFFRCQECPFEAHGLCRMQATCSLFHPETHDLDTINHARRLPPGRSWTKQFDKPLLPILAKALGQAQPSGTIHKLHALHVMFFRTKQCPSAGSGEKCPDFRSDLFNHDISKHFCFDDHQHDGQRVRRKPINADGSLAYTADLCREFELGHCAAGDRCIRAHGHLERQYHPHLYKLDPCQAWDRQSMSILGDSQQSSGGCPMGIRCPERHGDGDRVVRWWRSLRCESIAADFTTSADRDATTQTQAKGQWKQPLSHAPDPGKALQTINEAFRSQEEFPSMWDDDVADGVDGAEASRETETWPELCQPCDAGDHPWLLPVETFRRPPAQGQDAVHASGSTSEQAMDVLRAFKLIRCDDEEHRIISATLLDPNDRKQLLLNDTLRTCFRWHQADADERRNPYNEQGRLQQLRYDARVCSESQVSSNPMEFCASRCTDGRQCRCCKTTTELLYHPHVFKTRMCELDNCVFARCPHLCPYAHQPAELRSMNDLGIVSAQSDDDEELSRDASVISETNSIFENRVASIQEDLNKFIDEMVGSDDIRQQGGVNPVDEFRREIEEWARVGLVVPYTANITTRAMMKPIHRAPDQSSIVFAGTLQARAQKLDVAVKMYSLKRLYKDSTRPLWKDCHDILDEAYKLHQANVSRNENVVEFFGLSLQPTEDYPFGIITRYFPGHDVEAYMQEHKPTMHSKLAIAVQAARGLKYLHDCKLIRESTQSVSSTRSTAVR